MLVSPVHRFLHGRQPATYDRRVWVVTGQTQDWYFHDVVHGCVDLRRTLELWALAGGMDLVAYLDRSGVLDFSGNPDPSAAAQLFDDSRGRRPARYGQARPRAAAAGGASPAAPAVGAGASAGGRPAPRPAAAAPASPPDATPEEAARQAEQAAAEAGAAAGGEAQAILNTVQKIGRVLRSDRVRAMVIVEDLPALVYRLQGDARTAQHAAEVVHLIQGDWQRVSHRGLLVFIAPEAAPLDALLPPARFKKVEKIDVPAPRAAEIRSALERLTLRHGFAVQGMAAVSKALESKNHMEVALASVQQALDGRSDRVVTLEGVMQLPPINEETVAALEQELAGLVGLHEVKAKVEALGRKARTLRRRLIEGESELPDDTLHMVFTGNPGTGKTTVARIVARLFHALGVLRRDEVLERPLSQILSSNVGESREYMQALFEEARGAVLFLDEAHQLGDETSVQAREAVQTLVPLAWNQRHETVIILAGYADQMPSFFRMDPGLERRFPLHNRIEFPDYGQEELLAIFDAELRRLRFSMEPVTRARVQPLLRSRGRRPGFGNAGGVKSLIAELLESHDRSERAADRVLAVEDLPPLVRTHPDVLADARRELDELVGLDSVRRRIAEIVDNLQFDLEEEAVGNGTGELGLHPGNMRFTGPPGTGKTTVAQLLGKLLYGIGCTESARALVVSRSTLVGAYQGHSARAVQSAVEQARGGVLVVDEAYTLVQDGHDSFGREALDELVAQVTRPENRGTVFVLAGYTREIQKLLSVNPGMERRFPVNVEFPSFAPADCVELARRALARERMEAGPGVFERIEALAAQAAREAAERFGNAGWVGSLVGGAVERAKQRAVHARIPPGDPARRRVTAEDLPNPRESAVPRPTLAPRVRPSGESARVPTWSPHLDLDAGRAAVDAIARSAWQIVVTTADGQKAAGTGFFVTRDGLAVTSAHVVDDAVEIVALCGPARSPVQASVVARVEDADLAIIAIEGAAPGAPLPLGASRLAEPLDELLVFGMAHVRPGEPGRIVTARVARNDPDDPLHLESDGAIEPGFSGGPVVCPRFGAVVGVVRGGYGVSATILVRAERVRELLEELGYATEEAGTAGETMRPEA